MGYKFNPLIFSGFDLVDEGGTSWGPPVNTEADLPPVGTDGEARVVLATDHIYLWDDTTSQWIDTGFSVNTFSTTGNSDGLSLTSNDKGNNVTEQLLTLHAATATEPGAVSTIAQTFSGDKTFSNDVLVGQDLTVTGDLTVNGTTTTLNTTNLDVEDQNITVNINGNNASAEGGGITVNRTGTDGSFVYQNSLASRFKIGDLLSESEIVTVGHIQTITADKTMSGTLTMSALTAQRPMKLTAAGAVTSGLIDLADNVNDVTGILNVANGGTGLATAPTNGQLLIGNGTGYTLATLTPTANQTTVLNAAGSITIGTAQDIATISSPEFAGLTLTGFSGVVKAVAGVLSASLIIDADVDVPANNGGVGINAAKIHDGTVDNTEFGYLNGVTAAIQTQLDAKLDDFASVNDNRIVRTDINGQAVQESVVTLSDSGTMSGVNVLTAQVINALSTISASRAYPNINNTQRTGLSPTQGQGIYYTDTDRLQTYDGTQWREYAVVSPGDVSETEVAFAESQTNTTIFTLNAAVRAAKIYLSLYIDATADSMEFYEINAITDGATWDYTVVSNGNSDVLVDVSAGAVRYTSSTYAGFVGANSKFKYRVISTSI